MKKEINVSFIDKRSKRKFDELKEGRFENKMLYTFVNRAIDDLKLNPVAGVKIPRKLWPKEYVRKYKITNL